PARPATLGRRRLWQRTEGRAGDGPAVGAVERRGRADRGTGGDRPARCRSAGCAPPVVPGVEAVACGEHIALAAAEDAVVPRAAQPAAAEDEGGVRGAARIEAFEDHRGAGGLADVRVLDARAELVDPGDVADA